MDEIFPDWCPPAHQAVRAVTAANLNVYEAATRAVTELEWLLARTSVYGPISSLTHTWANLTRDATAVQLSTARWLLDL